MDISDDSPPVSRLSIRRCNPPHPFPAQPHLQPVTQAEAKWFVLFGSFVHTSIAEPHPFVVNYKGQGMVPKFGNSI